MKQVIGSYSLVILVDNKLLAVRDPLGIKPLCLGQIDNGYMVASESAAIDILNGVLIRDIAPGEMLIFKDGGVESNSLSGQRTPPTVFLSIFTSRDLTL